MIRWLSLFRRRIRLAQATRGPIPVKALANETVRARLKELDIEVIVDKPQDFAKVVLGDYERWGWIIKDTGFTLSE